MARPQLDRSIDGPDNPEPRGPTGWRLRVGGLRLSGGAGFVVVRTGDFMLMPGMPKHWAVQQIGLDLVGLS